MPSVTVTCPFCNATLAREQLAVTVPKVFCPRCGEMLPAHLVKDVVSTTSPVSTPAPPATSAGWSNRQIALGILGIMLVMAGVGLTMALLTVGWRRMHDYRTKRDTTVPPTMQAPGELAGLGFLPAESNVVAAVQVAELGKDPSAKNLLRVPRPTFLDLALGTVEKWTKLTVDDLDHIVLGTEIKDRLPQLTIVVQTRQAYDPATLAKALLPARPVEQRGKPLFRFSLQPGEGMLWCPQPRILVLLLRLDALKTADLDAIPLEARKGTEAPPRALHDLLGAQRINKQSLAWIAGKVDPDLVKELLAFIPVAAGEVQLLTKVQDFALSLFAQDGLVLVGHLRTGNEATTRQVQTYLEELKPAHVKMNVEAPPANVVDPAAQWVTVQVRGDPEGMRAFLGGKGKD